MLEETLNQINKNLERIANSLETALKYMKEPVTLETKDIKEAVKMFENVEVQKVQQQAVAPTTQPEIVQSQIPVTVQTESFTQEQLAVAMSNAVSAGKMDIIQGIMQQLGVQALTQVNPADYNKVAAMLKEKGVEV